MPLVLDDLLKQPHKFGAQNDTPHTQSVNGGISKAVPSTAELEKNLRSILISAGKPCRVSEILKDYRTLFGKKFPVRELGYSDPVEVLRQIPEACQIIDESHSDPLVEVKITPKNAHIFDLVKKSKNKPKPLKEVKIEPPNRDIFVPFSVQDAIRRILFQRREVRIKEFYSRLEREFDLKYMNLDVPPEILFRSLPHIVHYDATFVRSVKQIERSEVEIPEYLHLEDEHVIPSYRLSKLEIEVAVKISKLLEEHDCVKVMDIPKLYARSFGKELNWFRFGFEDLWRFLRLLPGCFQLTRLYSQYFILSPEVEDSDGVDLREINSDLFCGPDVYNQVLRNIKCLVLQVNKGINAKYLKSFYETMYFEKLVIKKDFAELLLELECFNLLKIEENGREIILFPSDEPEIEIVPETAIECEENGYPIDVLQLGDTLPSLEFPEINTENQLYCVACVSCVETPNDFYLKIVGIGEHQKEELYRDFEDMMLDMSDFYEGCPDLEIPLSLLRIGLICAVCSSGFWQRAEIIDVDGPLITVSLLDDGKCVKVSLTNLKFLLKEYASVPILAYKASLFNIKPVNCEWSFSAIETFLELTSDMCMIPKLMSVLIVCENDEGVLEVVLTDTSKDDDLHVGDELENREFAEFKITEESSGVFNV